MDGCCPYLSKPMRIQFNTTFYGLLCLQLTIFTLICFDAPLSDDVHRGIHADDHHPDGAVGGDQRQNIPTGDAPPATGTAARTRGVCRDVWLVLRTNHQ